MINTACQGHVRAVWRLLINKSLEITVKIRLENIINITDLRISRRRSMHPPPTASRPYAPSRGREQLTKVGVQSNFSSLLAVSLPSRSRRWGSGAVVEGVGGAQTLFPFSFIYPLHAPSPPTRHVPPRPTPASQPPHNASERHVTSRHAAALSSLSLAG